MLTLMHKRAHANTHTCSYATILGDMIVSDFFYATIERDRCSSSKKSNNSDYESIQSRSTASYDCEMTSLHGSNVILAKRVLDVAEKSSSTQNPTLDSDVSDHGNV